MSIAFDCGLCNIPASLKTPFSTHINYLGNQSLNGVHQSNPISTNPFTLPSPRSDTLISTPLDSSPSMPPQPQLNDSSILFPSSLPNRLNSVVHCISPVHHCPSQKKSLHGDRFIPDRRSMDFSVSNFALSRTTQDPLFTQSPKNEPYRRSLARALFSSVTAPDLMAGEVHIDSPFDQLPTGLSETNYSSPTMINMSRNRSDNDLLPASPSPLFNMNGYSPSTLPPNNLKSPPTKILSFSNRSTMSPQDNNAKVLYNQDYLLRNASASRIIPKVPERILDAPNMIDDYYLNLLDWSCKNVLCVALGQCVYLWNANNSEIVHLMTLESHDDYVSSVCFLENGRYLAVGTNYSTIRLWDLDHQKQVRIMHGHLARVSSLSWNGQVLSSGSCDACIFNHDVRLANHHVSTFQNHCHEVCGLKWSTDGSLLASGSNDNILNIWSMNSSMPLFSLTQHKAAVKAISWCPWQRNLLASGGGTADRTIKFWNITTGTCLSSIDTKSQVGSLMWSKHVRELVSGHGYSQNQITVWKYPSLTKQVELNGHTNRVLHMAMSPDGTTIVSASGDETLRFWRIFDIGSTTKLTNTSFWDKNLHLRMIR